MPILILILIASLAGCAPASPERQLINYLEDSARGVLSDELSDAAREAQVRALRIISDLGWSQSGRAQYSDFAIIDDSHFEFCLDVTGIRFTDQAMNQVQLERTNKGLLMRAETTQIAGTSKITDLKEVGDC